MPDDYTQKVQQPSPYYINPTAFVDLKYSPYETALGLPLLTARERIAIVILLH